MTNVLFKIYFKVNTLQLCSKLISVIEGPGGIMENLHAFPMSDVVMYKYYLGRLKMFEDKYEGKWKREMGGFIAHSMVVGYRGL